jgi:5-methylcytosine-specific restriction endonuclease McrA
MAQIAIRKEEKTQSKKIDLAEKKEILEQLKNKNTFQSKAVLVEALPSYAPEEANSISPIKDNQVQITLTLSQDQYNQLKEAQDYLSNKVRSLELKDYLLYLTKNVLEKKNTIRPAATAIPAVGTVAKQVQKQRPYINQSLKAEVFRAADFQCQYVSKDNQKRCEATRFLHIDHVQPIALDGATNQENLRVYCQAHNHLAALEGGFIC